MPQSLTEIKEIFERELEKTIPRKKADVWASKRLYECMRYVLLSHGKRLRPLMVFASALATRKNETADKIIKNAMPAALAIEYVHTYSLVHDDLPSMDNDDFRRGRLSAHVKFDEALAILAGDALLADAFSHALSSPNNPYAITKELALASGSGALVAGQAEDLNPFDVKQDINQWLQINAAKTARLFEAAAVMGGLSNNASFTEIKDLRAFGQAFGQAFQMKDDEEDDQGLKNNSSTTSIEKLKQEQIQKALEAIARLPNQEYLRQIIETSAQ